MSDTGILDLSGADTSGFQPIPSGQYNAVVSGDNTEWTETKGGKMPAGQPMLKVRFNITDETAHDGTKVKGRPQFTQFVLPKPDATTPEKRATMQGIFVQFLMAL